MLCSDSGLVEFKNLVDTEVESDVDNEVITVSTSHSTSSVEVCVITLPPEVVVYV